MKRDLHRAAGFRRLSLSRWLLAALSVFSTLQWVGRARADSPNVTLRSQTVTPGGVQSAIEIQIKPTDG
jgi:hypothetical protein